MSSTADSGSPSRRFRLALAAAAGVVLALGTAYTLSMTSLPSDRVALFDQTISSANLAVATLDADFVGKNQITVAVSVKNDDAVAAHAGDVEVQLLDANGGLLMKQEQATGTVAASATWSATYTFSQNGIVTNYGSLMVVVGQTS